MLAQLESVNFAILFFFGGWGGGGGGVWFVSLFEVFSFFFGVHNRWPL